MSILSHEEQSQHIYALHFISRDAVMINFVSFFTSMYAGLAVFSIIGYMANEYNLNIEEVIDSGTHMVCHSWNDVT